MRLLTCAALAAAAFAQLPSVPHGGGACQTDWDCSLGGECISNHCVCDAWFTNTDCSALNLQPSADAEAGTCGARFNSYYSWGGRSVLLDDGQYHLFASFMCRHATLSQWTTVSSSAHLVSSNPVGPFTWSTGTCDAATGICTPVIIPWSHNTVILQNAAGASPSLLLWHIGDGIDPPSDWFPCYNTSDVPPVRSPPPATASATAGTGTATADHGYHPLSVNPGGTAYVQLADAPDGPWTRFDNNNGVSINFTGSWTAALAGNPAPLMMPDGSVRLYFTATPCPPNSGALAANCIAVATSSNWSGPFSMNAAPHPITYPESEDPFVFQDPRGNFHLLTNVNTCHARCAQGVPCGGHAWSRDGLAFSNLTIGAFGPVLRINGSYVTNAYVERPLVVQAADRTPLAFHVGLGRTSYVDSCNWVQLFCTPGAQGCGPTWPPPPPPPTYVELRNGGSCLQFNASAFPCSGTGAAAGCPVTMGPCDAAGAGAVWVIPPNATAGTFASNFSQGLALDVDCDSTSPHTLVKVLASGAASLTFHADAGTIEFGSSGMCFNTGQGPAVPPCGGRGEVWLPNQIQLTACNDPTAAGWTAVTV